MVVHFSRQNVPFVAPAIKVMPQRLANLRVEETVQKRNDETLRAEENGSRYGEYLAPDTLVRAVDDDEVGDAEERYQYEQGLRGLPVLARFDGVGRPELCDQHPHDAQEKDEIDNQHGTGRALDEPIDVRFTHPRAFYFEFA